MTNKLRHFSISYMLRQEWQFFVTINLNPDLNPRKNIIVVLANEPHCIAG
jgi:hypothetical protein